MPRGYRGLVIAAFLGLIFTSAGLGSYATAFALDGATPKKENTVSYQSAEKIDEAATTATNYAAYPNINSEECYHSKNHDTGDLCAQWRAAIAAEKSAKLTWWGNLIGGVGGILSLGSLILVVLALRQTDKSLQQSGEANDSAKHSLGLTRELFDLENRPFLHIEGISPIVANPSGDGCESLMRIGNSGKFPAKNVMIRAKWFTAKAGNGVIPNINAAQAYPLGRDIVPGIAAPITMPLEIEGWNEFLDSVKSGSWMIGANIQLTYDGISGEMEPMDATIIFGKDGPRAPSPSDNLKTE